MDEKKSAENSAATELNGQPVKALPDGVASELTLPSGKKATILFGYGSHAEQAQEMATDDKGKLDVKKYQRAMMHLLILVDGEKLFPEEFSKLPMKDYLALQGEFAKVNF